MNALRNPAAGALLAEIRRRPGRLVLTGLAILVATVFAAGTLLLSETLRGYVVERAADTPTGAAAVLRPGARPTAQALAATLATPGVAAATVHTMTALPVTGAGPGTRWQIDTDPMTGPLTRLPAPVAGTVAAGPGEAVVGAATARRSGAALGTRLTLLGFGRDGDPVPYQVTVVGIVPLRWDGTNAVVLTPVAMAAVSGGSDGVPDGVIDVAAVPGTDPADLAARLVPVAGPSGSVVTGEEQRAQEVRQASEAVTAVLLGVGVFAALAVLAAAIVVASTLRIVLTQRRTQLALLRCVGAARGQILVAVLAEAALSGLVAGVLGVAVAVAAGYAVVGLIGALGGPVVTLVLWWPGLAACLLTAVLTTVVAALAPAVAASRIPPVAALGGAAAGESGTPATGRRLVLAAVAAVLAAGGAFLATRSDSPLGALVLVAASGLLTLAALVAVGPLLVRLLAATVGRALAVVGREPARLAVANAAHVPRRTAATISVLALGAGLTASLLVAIAAAQADGERSIAAQVPAAVAIQAPDAQAAAAALAADPALLVRIPAGDSDTVLVDPAPGASPERLRAAVDRAMADRTDARVQYAADVRAELESTLDTMRIIGFGLVGMTLLVAVFGVGITLMLSVAERTRETGLLRALGLRRGGVRAAVAWEAVLAGGCAAVLGAVLGGCYGALGSSVLGMPPELTVGAVAQLAALVVGVVAVAALAAVAPAARAGRVPPTRALQDA